MRGQKHKFALFYVQKVMLSKVLAFRFFAQLVREENEDFEWRFHPGNLKGALEMYTI